MSVSVRPAGVEDLDELAPLFSAYRQFYGSEADVPAARAFLTARLRAGESTVFVATDASGPLLGFTQLYPSFCSLTLAPIFVLYDLFVSPEARGGGVATALLDAARAHGEASGCSRLELSTAVTNTPAQRLYRTHGWQLDDEYLHYELPLG